MNEATNQTNRGLDEAVASLIAMAMISSAARAEKQAEKQTEKQAEEQEELSFCALVGMRVMIADGAWMKETGRPLHERYPGVVDHPAIPAEAWIEKCQTEGLRLGYWEWVSQLASEAWDEAH